MRNGADRQNPPWHCFLLGFWYPLLAAFEGFSFHDQAGQVIITTNIPILKKSIAFACFYINIYIIYIIYIDTYKRHV